MNHNNKKNLPLFAVFLIIFFGFIITNLLIFFVKYNVSVSNNANQHNENAKLLLDNYINKFNSNITKGESKIDKIFNNELGSDVFILKKESDDNFKIIAKSDNKINLDGLRQNCNFKERDFEELIKKKEFKYQEVLPDSKIKVCLIKYNNNYAIGMKKIFAHFISGTKDPEFINWIIKNLSISITVSGVIGIIFFLLLSLISKSYNKLYDKFINTKNIYKTKLEQIKRQLYYDEITNILNKVALKKIISKSKKAKIILISIDDLDKIYDYYGKDISDNLLICLSDLLKEFAILNRMKLYKVKIDCFALLENGDFFIDRYEELAKQLLDKFKGRIINIKNLKIEVNNTIGFAIDPKDTLRKAEIALEIAKIQKRDYLCYYRGLACKDEYENQIKKSENIRDCIINNNVIPFYQSIFDKHLNTTRYEVLIRIIKSNEIIEPNDFLEISRQIKRYPDLEKTIIIKSIKKLLDNPELNLSINLNGCDMIDGDISKLILKLLNEHNIGNRVIFEITEDNGLENFERVTEFINKIKNAGVKIAIDNFGAGYSDFSRILKLRPDFLKIDESIIKNIDLSKDSYLVAKAIVAFAKDLGIKTIAKYVYSKDVFDVCKKLGIDEFQGFYLSQPTEKIEGAICIL